MPKKPSVLLTVGMLASSPVLAAPPAESTPSAVDGPHSAQDKTSKDKTPKEKALKTLLPKAPKTHKGPSKVQPRNRDDIYEQINGGSASFIENGMSDAVFAQYAPKKGPAGAEIQVEVYRFAAADGALKQFKTLYENEGKPWEGGLAVVHEYGVEAVVGRFIIKATYNEGPNQEAATALATALAASAKG